MIYIYIYIYMYIYMCVYIGCEPQGGLNLISNNFKVILQKSIPTQIRQLVLYMSSCNR